MGGTGWLEVLRGRAWPLMGLEGLTFSLMPGTSLSRKEGLESGMSGRQSKYTNTGF